MPSHPSSVVPFRNPYSSVGNTSPIHIEQPTLGQSLKQGFGFGAGSAIAHRIFGLSPTLVGQSVSDKKVESTCEKELTAFETCLKSKSSDDFCGEEQINLTRCLQKSPKSTSN
jgi:hypothetical protein